MQSELIHRYRIPSLRVIIKVSSKLGGRSLTKSWKRSILLRRRRGDTRPPQQWLKATYEPCCLPVMVIFRFEGDVFVPTSITRVGKPGSWVLIHFLCLFRHVFSHPRARLKFASDPRLESNCNRPTLTPLIVHEVS